MATKAATEFFVRPGFNLHREVIQKVRGKDTKVRKLYQSGEKVENLTLAEQRKYQHLIENGDQVKSRDSKATKGE